MALSLDRFLIGHRVSVIFACGFISKKKTPEFCLIIFGYQYERNVGGKRAKIKHALYRTVVPLKIEGELYNNE